MASLSGDIGGSNAGRGEEQSKRASALLVKSGRRVLASRARELASSLGLARFLQISRRGEQHARSCAALAPLFDELHRRHSGA